MKNTNPFLLGTLALSTLLGSVSSVHAAAWDGMNNPNGFNVDWHRTNYTMNKNTLFGGKDVTNASGVVPLEQTPWGDSYWPKNRGAFTYRWHEFQESGASQQLTSADRKRLFFSYSTPKKEQLVNMTREQLMNFSPLEKYSIVIGDFNYDLVNEYRNKNSADDAYWEGYCHAWSAASAHYTEPKPKDVPVTINGTTVVIPFGSGDVKALLTANYADLAWGTWSGRLSSFKRRFNKNAPPKAELRYVGNMCKSSFIYPTTKFVNGVEVLADYADYEGRKDSELEAMVQKYQSDVLRIYGNKDPKTLSSEILSRLEDAKNPNLAKQARLAAQSPACSDTNAGAFHVVVANQLGLMKEGFMMDKTRDAEIWNQPVYKYESQITGYEPPNSSSAPGTARLANVETKLYYADDTDYGYTFWNPSNSGIFGLQQYFTSFLEEYAKYQNMLIKEGDLEAPEQYPEHVHAHSDYVYKLELDRNDNIIGGQWVSFERPDDLYFMKPVGFVGDFDQLGKIYEPVIADSRRH